MNSIGTKFRLHFIKAGLSALMLIAFVSSCKQKTQPIAKVQDKVYYTCSMHPQVHELHPRQLPYLRHEADQS